jgi:hypothetical protein
LGPRAGPAAPWIAGRCAGAWPDIRALRREPTDEEAFIYLSEWLVAVDGPLKTATFEKVSEQNKGERITVPFDMLHVSPPQSPPDEIKSSPPRRGWCGNTTGYSGTGAPLTIHFDILT